ncbi:hypothetical protein [Lysobacter sp. FW306-1B-D06B]|uniref:hypothetical protein n=1 Tax=Lysobacter sp. FW306-1B-D06B TaxID=3140250 RepID=UPI003140B577
MDVFNFANATFTKSDDGQWMLDRDWTMHPATQIETEVLFAHCMQLDQLLAPVLRHFMAGNIQTAEGLDNAKFEEVVHWLAAVRGIMGPPRPLGTEEMHTASLDAA